MEGLSQVSPDRALCQRVAESRGGRGFRVLRHDPVGTQQMPDRGNGRHRRHERRAGTGGRPTLYAAVFPAGSEGEGASDGRRPDHGLSRPHCKSHMDVTADQGKGAGQTGRASGSASAIPTPGSIIRRSMLCAATLSAICAGRRPSIVCTISPSCDSRPIRTSGESIRRSSARSSCSVPNTETFSAGLLQPPYFDCQGDAASNYGSAGAGMAHEISHSFDELGNIYDDQGRLGMWWTRR